jgi:uncharacterized membrane protein YgcG
LKRKWILILFLISSLLFSIAAVQNEKTYIASSYVTEVVVQPGGDLSITETVVFDFIGGPFTFVYREIPQEYTDGISDLTVSMDGRVLSEGSEPGQYEVDPSGPTRITWHFNETFDRAHTFSLQYRVMGAVRQQPESDFLEWNLLPTEYEYFIDSVEAVVLYPSSINLVQPPTITRGEAQVEMVPGEVVFSAFGVGPNEPLTVALRFAPAALITSPPAWQLSEIQSAEALRQALPFALLIGFLAAAGCIVFFLVWYRRIGQPALDVRAMPKQMSPPASLPPAYAGLLAKKSDTAAWDHALGTLIDLSRRGWLQLVEERGVLNSRSFTIHLLQDPSRLNELKPHEQVLIEMLFKGRKGWQTEASAKELSSAVSSHFKQFVEPVKKELEAQGWIDPQRRSSRTLMYVLGTVLLLLGMFLAIGMVILGVSSRNAANWPMLQSALLLGLLFSGLTVAGIAGLIVASGISPLSDQALQLAARWESFAGYLKDVTRNSEPVIRPDLFEAYLAYAASFGLAETWAKYFHKQGMQQAPAWFISTVPGENMGGFIAIMAATSTSGQSGAGGGAGGGGAGGGGGSGAG